MPNPVASTPSTPQKLSAEPGFVSFDMFKPHYAHKIPLRTAGLLAFWFVEEDSDSEMVIRLLLLDDLAKGYLESRPFCARANKAAYLVFPATDGCDERKGELAARLKIYAQLTEKYNVPQTTWPMGKFSAGPRLWSCLKYSLTNASSKSAGDGGITIPGSSCGGLKSAGTSAFIV